MIRMRRSYSLWGPTRAFAGTFVLAMRLRAYLFLVKHIPWKRIYAIATPCLQVMRGDELVEMNSHSGRATRSPRIHPHLQFGDMCDCRQILLAR